MNNQVAWQYYMVHINRYILFCALVATAISFYVGQILTPFALIAIAYLVATKLPQFTRQDTLLACAFISYSLLDLFDFFYYNQADVRTMDVSPEPLLSLILLAYLIKQPASSRMFYTGVACGAIVAGLFGLWQFIYLDAHRALGFGFRAPGIYGNLSLLSAYMASIGFVWACVTKQAKYIIVLCAVGAVCGAMASMFSGTRGGWLSIPVVGCILLFTLVRLHILSLRAVVAVMLSAIVIAGLLYAIPATNVKNRVQHAYDTVISFQEDKTAARGEARLDMLYGVWLLADRAPLLGMGKQGYVDAQIQLFNEGKIGGDPSHDDPHNEIAMYYIYHGVLGLLVLAIFYGVPLTLFVRRTSACDTQAHKLAALAGCLFIVGCIICGMTGDFLGVTDDRRTYLLFVLALWSLCRPDASASNTGKQNRPDELTPVA